MLHRQEVRPFTDKQIALVQNFAAQAVIAIENTRLLNELRQSLEQQTATRRCCKSSVRSPGELQPVFEAMLDNATRICGARVGVLFRYDDGAFTAIAKIGVSADFAAGPSGSADPTRSQHWASPPHRNETDRPHRRQPRWASLR